MPSAIMFMNSNKSGRNISKKVEKVREKCCFRGINVRNDIVVKENVLLIRIKTISDALEYLQMKKVSSETKVIVIVRNSAFLKFLLKQKSCDLIVYCAKEKIHKVYQGIVYILDSTTIIDVTAEELFRF